jgi:carbon-monoxide dehydrogenase large subunit
VTTITHVDRLAGGRSDRAGTYAILLFRFVGARSTLRPLGRPRGGAQPEANEAGTIGSLPAIVNAVVDALSPFGIQHIDIPMTPQRVWKAIQERSQA